MAFHIIMKLLIFQQIISLTDEVNIKSSLSTQLTKKLVLNAQVTGRLFTRIESINKAIHTDLPRISESADEQASSTAQLDQVANSFSTIN